jgi:hypothetical protein
MYLSINYLQVRRTAQSGLSKDCAFLSAGLVNCGHLGDNILEKLAVLIGIRTSIMAQATFSGGQGKGAWGWEREEHLS